MCTSCGATWYLTVCVIRETRGCEGSQRVLDAEQDGVAGGEQHAYGGSEGLGEGGDGLVGLHSLNEEGQVPAIVDGAEGSQLHGLGEELGVGAAEGDGALGHVVNARPVEKLGEGCGAKDPRVAQSWLLRIATVVYVVQVAADQQTGHLHSASVASS